MARQPPFSISGAIITTAQVVQALNTLAPPAPPSLPKPPPVNPMEGLATAAELKAYAMKDGAFFLGRVHQDHGVSFPVGMQDDRHVFTLAQTRAGKGTSFLLPNMILWPGPLFAIDPKGEGASICALRRASAEAAAGTGTSVRAFLGQKVAILDPLGQVRGPARAFRVEYNPLADIDMTRGGGVRAIHAAAGALIESEEGNGAHFSENAATVIAGLIEAMKLTKPENLQTLPQLRSEIVAGVGSLRELLNRPEAQTVAGLASEAASVIEEVGDEEWGSFRTTLSRNLKWLSDPAMQAHLAPSSFSLRQAMQEGWSVFVVLPPEEMPYFKGWLRIIVRTALDAKISMGFDQRGTQTLCILDEFATLGHFPLIEQSAGYMAGYGMKLVPVIQNIGQLKKLYPRNWETFTGNAGVFIAFGTNDLETETYIADRLGRIFVTEAASSTSAGSGGGGANFSSSSNLSRHERPVRFPNEIRIQGARETGRAFAILASGRSFTVARTPYTEFPSGLYDSLAFIKQWEAQHWLAKGN